MDEACVLQPLNGIRPKAYGSSDGNTLMPTVRYTTVNGRVIAEKRGGVRKLYRPDHLGSTIALYDNTQTKTDTWVYWPYGAVRTRTGTTATPFQFVGVLGYFRDSTDRAYVRTRMLRTDLGTWMTVDPLWPDEAPYGYVASNPLSFIDPSGFQVEAALGGLYSLGGSTSWNPLGWCILVVAVGVTVYVVCNAKDCPPTATDGESEVGPRPNIVPKPRTWAPTKPRPKEPWINPLCPKCPKPPPPEHHEVPPKRPHYFKEAGGCCYFTHSHIFVFQQDPVTCICRLKKLDGFCGGPIIPGPCL